MNEQEYRGWLIRETEEPWALRVGLKIEYNNDIKLFMAETIEDAKNEIDQIIEEND